jgi:hypothetical protein
MAGQAAQRQNQYDDLSIQKVTSVSLAKLNVIATSNRAYILSAFAADSLVISMNNQILLHLDKSKLPL